MKKMYRVLMILLMLGLVFGLTFGQDFVDTNQVTIIWDRAVAIDPADIMADEVFRSPYPFVGDRQDPDAHERLGISITEQMVITFVTEGEYVIGVRTVRDVKGTGVFKYSDLIWSDIDGIPDPFVIRYYKSPDKPINIRYL